ncbi:hypothetical protein [Persephonella sp. KM09-Lau-8]|uniref:hypothetical protein n=1 Tax=Persephonella sp. KM09-Lau-8 TaxID=1158345 RepID=UPI000497CA52|nr:hypothetical protein [Persephonella sp. KM09-Lau-8]
MDSRIVEELLKGFADFLVSSGLKPSSVPNYIVPLKKLLGVYLSDKRDISSYQKNLLLRDFYSDLQARLGYYLSRASNIKSYNLKRTLEYFGKYIDSLFVDVESGCSIVFKDGSVVSVPFYERDTFGWFVYKKDGYVYTVNPSLIKYVLKKAADNTTDNT